MTAPNALLVAIICDGDFYANEAGQGLESLRAGLTISPDGTVTL